jgi:tetratricopeptide (TPR) repeat protein
MLKLQLAHYEEQYELAEKIILEIIHISEQYSALKRKSKLMQNYMNLAYTQFYLHKYEEAYLNALKATKEYIEQDFVLNINREACVFALIYLNRYPEAEGWIAKMLSSGSVGNNPEQLSKRHLMMGVLKYLQNDFKGAFKHLQFTKEVETDREGWNLGIRMLNIYLTLSTEKVDLADQRINAMRKHIERTSKMRNLRKRDIIIFRILSHLSRSGFDFKETWEERKKDFALLRSQTPDCFWVPRSHELIIFDQWFEAKMNNVTYSPIFPSPEQAPEKLVDISVAEEA